jgi:hypothetical protein
VQSQETHGVYALLLLNYATVVVEIGKKWIMIVMMMTIVMMMMTTEMRTDLSLSGDPKSGAVRV